MTEIIALIAGVALALAGLFVWQWWRRGRSIAEFNRRSVHLEMSLAAAKRSLVQLSTQHKEKEALISALNEGIARGQTQIEHLRDLVKMHVARRREFDEWASPIRESLGDAVGKVLGELKDRVARQEFAMRRQERVVAEAQDQYRDKRDELERMRRELTLKNYHIAALNERFIRIEERIQELMTHVRNTPQLAEVEVPGEMMARTDLAAAAPAQSPETERFTLQSDPDKDWMGVLDDWHRQLQERFERLDALHAQIRGGPAKPAADEAVARRRDDSAA